MDNGTHYLSYDPESIWRAMITAYVNAGGDVLYPGDEKEMLLRGVQSIVTQTLAGVDAALRMDTLRYAVGAYLDLYGEKRGCTRIPAAAATCTVDIAFAEYDGTLAAGTAMTADGEGIYLLAEDVEHTASHRTVRAEIVCQNTGGIGNALLSGMQMQLMIPNPDVLSIYTTRDASGGQNEEDDETYRERIRVYGLTGTTTGPRAQYERAAKSVTSEILDARALNLGGGVVGVYLLLARDEGAEAILDSTEKALNAENVRPLTDTVVVSRAEPVPYTLHIRYTREDGSQIASAIDEAVKAYRVWQDMTIGRPFNPDRLMATLYQAGALRVTWGEGSNFDGGEVSYTEIAQNAHCKGEITVAVVE